MADMEEVNSAARIGFIPEGSRNSTISHAAGKILKRWGDTPEAYEKFMEVVSQCSPPLPDEEVKREWGIPPSVWSVSKCASVGCGVSISERAIPWGLLCLD